MIFIATVVLILFLIVVLYKCFLHWSSKPRAYLKARLSRAIFQLMVDMWDDCYRHLETICEADGDEPFEPYLDSPLRTCTSQTEFILIPPQEEIVNNGTTHSERVNIPPRGRGARRRPAILLPQPPPPPQQRVPVIVQRNLPIANLFNRQRIQERQVQNRNILMLVNEIEALRSPPPQDNNRN